MSFKYTPFSFFRYFGSGISFNAFLLVALPLLVTQQKGCSTRIECASLVTPADPNTEIPVNTSFVWSAVEGEGMMYRVVIQDTVAKKILFEQNVTNTRVNLTEALPFSTVISVLVVPLNADGSAKGCKTHYFKTEAPVIPECVTLESPSNSATGVSLTPVLRWVKDGAATNYLLSVGTAANSWNILNNEDVGDKTNFSTWPENTFAFNQKVFVRIIPKNVNGEATGCSTFSFTTKEDVPPPPAPTCAALKLTQPTATTDVPLDTEIAWEGVDGLVHGYKIKIGTSSGTGDIEDMTFVIGEKAAAISPREPLPTDTDIFVSIVPYNDANGTQTAENCTVFQFKTEKVELPAPSTCPNITFPADGATGVSLSDLITWEAASDEVSGYRLQAGLEEGNFNLLDKDVGAALSHPAYFLFYDKETFLRVVSYNSNKEIVDCKTISFTTGSRPEGAPKYIRREISEMPAGHPDLEAFVEGVQALKALANSNVFSWQEMARVHSTNDQCQHQNWHFLPWHRIYLFHLEQAIRENTDHKDFALPYWDWTQYPEIPDPFWQANMSERRNVQQGQVRWGDETNESRIGGIMSENDYETLGSRFGTSGLESPHNSVHSRIGGIMGSFSSPLDPVFYCHHANVDRLWAMWNQEGGRDGRGRENPPQSTGADWWTKNYPGHFDLPGGNSRLLTNGEVTRTILLDYRYDSQNEIPGSTDNPRLNNFQAKAYYVAEQDMDLTFTAPYFAESGVGQVIERNIAIDDPEFFRLSNFVAESQADEEQFIQVYLYLKDIVQARGNEIYIKVFINCDYLNPNVPESDPHHVGNIYFFRGDVDHPAHEEGKNFVFDLTETLRRLKDIDHLPSLETGLTVQLVAVPTNSDGSVIIFEPGQASVAIVNKVIK